MSQAATAWLLGGGLLLAGALAWAWRCCHFS